MKIRLVIAACAAIALAIPSFSQDVVTIPAAPVSTTAPIPHFVRYGGTLSESGDKPVQLRFALYENQSGGEPVWSEVQTVTPIDGKYAVLLGAATVNGLPQSVFSAAQARWLGITVGAGQEQPRTILLATPYSLESSDAQTLAGHPASDFVLAGSNTGSNSSSNPAPKSDGTKKPNTATDISQIDVNPGLTITNGGTGPTVTMGIDSTVVPELALANTFTATQTISSGNLAIPATTSKTNGTITSGGNAIFQSFSKTSGANNLFLGAGAGNFSNSGKNNTGIGNVSLAQLTTAAGDMALGTDSLGRTTSGSYNTAIGAFAGYYNITGSYNTYIGNSAGPPPGSGTRTNSTAIGASAVVNASNAIVLGGTGAYAVNVGIGTPTPQYTLDVQGTGNFTGAVNFGGNQTLTGLQTITGSSTAGTSGVLTATDTASSGIAIYGNGATGVYGNSTGSSGTGIYGNASATGSTGVFGTGQAYGVEGSSGQTGVYGATSGSGPGAADFGVYGVATDCCAAAGIYGLYEAPSTTGADDSMVPSGIWADGNSNVVQALLATTDDANAGFFANNCPSGCATLVIENYDTTGNAYPLWVGNQQNGTECTVNPVAELICSGGEGTVVPVEGDRKVATYGVQSAENWIEDVGSGQLNGGMAHVSLETTFGQTVNAGMEYHVFLTPKGDCKGLYVANETAAGFEVHELGGGTSNISFDYRIMAKRKGYEAVRLEDLTARINAEQARMAQRSKKRPATPSVSPQPNGTPGLHTPPKLPSGGAAPTPHAVPPAPLLSTTTRAAVEVPQK